MYKRQSSDRTAEILASYHDPRIKLHVFINNVGAVANHRYCFDHCTAQYIALLNSDDVWEREHLKESVEYLDTHQSCGAVYSWASLIDENSCVTDKCAEIFKQKNKTRAQWLSYFFTHGNCICHPSMVIRKDVYNTVAVSYTHLLLMRDMGLVDSFLSVILVEIASAIPFQTLLMKGFIGGVPKEIDEAAMIDGCTRMQTLFHVIMPVIVPGIVTVISFAFINCWNEYLLPYTFLSSGSKFPLSVGLRYMITQTTINYSGLAAGAVIALLPPLCLFGYVQRYLVSVSYTHLSTCRWFDSAPRHHFVR